MENGLLMNRKRFCYLDGGNKQSETFLKRYGSIRPTSGGKG